MQFIQLGHHNFIKINFQNTKKKKKKKTIIIVSWVRLLEFKILSIQTQPNSSLKKKLESNETYQPTKNQIELSGLVGLDPSHWWVECTCLLFVVLTLVSFANDPFTIFIALALISSTHFASFPFS
jgi:hypothetical protein